MTYILQKYVLKELLRGFLLTAIALTCMMGFGGGVMDMLRSQGITAHEMLTLMVYLIPFVLAYSLPIAALFSTTITYGRLSADNEINACRASGVNIYRLFVPAIILSILVSGITFWLVNYQIPHLAARIEQIVKRDIQTLVYLELKNRGFKAQMQYALHCGRINSVILPETQPDGTLSAGQIELGQVAFLRHERGMPVFYGTAKTALILFETDKNNPTVSIHLNQVRAFNEDRGEMTQVDYFPIGPILLPPLTASKLKFLSLPTLRAIREDPLRYDRVKDAQTALMTTLKNSLIYQDIARQLEEKRQCELKDVNGRSVCTFTADGYAANQRKDGRIRLEGNVIVQYYPPHDAATKYLAKAADISASALSEKADPTIDLELKDARVTEVKDKDFSRAVYHDQIRVGPLQAPAAALETARRMTTVELLSPTAKNLDLNADLIKRRLIFAREREGTIGKCTAEIHSRMAFSCSALVLLTLGAGLGIIFRGGHFVSAFGLSFIPMLVVILLIMTGKQYCGAGLTQVGTIVIWLGLGLVAVANVVILGKYLRR